jgi:phage tail protein X
VNLPDEPRWVEAHGIAGDPESWRRACGDGVAYGSDRAQLVVVAGADISSVLALAAGVPAHTLLVVEEVLAAALREAGRPVDRVILHTLPDPAALPDLEGAVLLPADASLDHVPDEVARELRASRSAIWTAYVDGLPVSFAHAPWHSARYFDVSIDTLPGARQLGLATITAAAMIRHERGVGREPVWGADEDNHGSLRLAKRLGFVPVDELWVAAPEVG